MIRLTLRQFRTQAVVALGALLVVAVLLAITGPTVVHLAAESAVTKFPGPYLSLHEALSFVLLAIPALIGIFWGAPLVARELETGTFRLAWTQSVTRTRWLAVKLAVLGVSSMVVAGLFSLMVTWWSGPIDRVKLNLFDSAWFGARGITPIGYALFAFALGVTAGVAICRVQPAIVTTLVAFIFARVAVTLWVRPHFLAPVHTSFALTSPMVGIGVVNNAAGATLSASASIPNDWVYSAQIVSKTGHALIPQAVQNAIPDLGAAGGAHAQGVGQEFQTQFQTGIPKLSTTYHVLVTYQPGSRYWAFQGLETTLFIALALALFGVCFWWVRGRVS